MKMKVDIVSVNRLPPAYCDASEKEANESCNKPDSSIGESETPVDSAVGDNKKTGVGLKAACVRNKHCLS